MNKPAYDMQCEKCSAEYPGEEGRYRCLRCGFPLEAVFQVSRDMHALRGIFQQEGPHGVWRYASLLPVHARAHPVTMGEGNTPLVAAQHLANHLGVAGLHVKWEGANPTGTFKDRCMTVAMTKVVEYGGNGVVLGSAGNAASAAAAYAARAGLPCHVLVPHTTSGGRVAQTMAYGAKVILVRGSVNECIDLIEKVRERYGWHNVTTARCHNPYQAEGPKTIGYEIARNLGWQTPDFIVAPAGGGGLLSAIWKSYQDLHAAGLASRKPRMIAVQAAGCAPLVRAYLKGAPPEQIDDWGSPETVAKAIADTYPLDGRSALKAVYDSGGFAVGVSDDEIIDGQLILAQQEGIFVEAASSTTVAAVVRLVKERKIAETSTVVCIASGTGLKDAALASGKLPSPPTVEPREDDLDKALRKCP